MDDAESKIIGGVAKKRRTYLFHKTKYVLLSAIGCGCIVCFAVTTVVGAFCCTAPFFISPLALIWFTLGLMAVAISGPLTFRSYRLIVICNRKIASLEHVPSLREYKAALLGGERKFMMACESVKDKAKKRRNYLLRKLGLAFVIGFAGLALLWFGMAAVCSWGDEHGFYCYPIHAYPWLFFYGFACSLSYRLCRSTVRKSRAMPYVPPVHQQIATLPAEEVLLRGSCPGPSSPEQLLRPAANHGTSAQELLVPSETMTPPHQEQEMVTAMTGRFNTERL